MAALSDLLGQKNLKNLSQKRLSDNYQYGNWNKYCQILSKYSSVKGR